MALRCAGSLRILERPCPPQPGCQGGDMILMGAGGQAQGSRRKAPSPGDGRSGRNSGAPAIGAIDLLEEVEPGNKKGVAPKRLRCCVFGVVKPHGRQNSPRWLTSGCE